MAEKYCQECGTALIEKELENEGMVPFCPKCNQYRFPLYNVAVSMIVISRQTDKILLIKQYGRPFFILVAGYVNRTSNTLMCNFTAFVDDESEMNTNEEIDSYQWFTKDEAKENIKKNSLAEYFLNAYLNEVQGA